ARKYFYPLTNSFDCYKGKYRGETPVAENVSQNILTLPLYADLKIDDVDEICRLISSIK
ncbi:MAG: DegT/DnrJ/EryC1/StrS family aminotransferase, partial [Oscillospiraceae bacterium]